MLDGNTMARLDGRESAGLEHVGEADGWERWTTKIALLVGRGVDG